MKKHLHLAVVFLCTIAAGFLSLPLLSTKYASQEVILWGWNLWNADIWGKAALIAPILLVSMMYLPISWRHRRLLLMILALAFCICYTKALYILHHSLHLYTATFVRLHYGLAAYPQLILFALLLTWIRNGSFHTGKP